MLCRAARSADRAFVLTVCSSLRLPSLIEIDHRDCRLRGLKEPTRRLVRDPGRLDVASSGEGCGVLVERRDQRTPRKGTKRS
jgi:hypothetical protein